MLTFYLQPNKPKAKMVIEALFSGNRKARLSFGPKYQIFEDGAAVFYGVTRETREIYDEIVSRGLPYYYVDNGYFCSTYKGGEYFRITKNAEQHSGLGTSNGERFAKLGIEITPMRYRDGYALIILQSDWWYERHGTTKAAWLASAIEWAKNHTNDIVIRQKPTANSDSPSLEKQMRECAFIVAHTSNVLVDGIIQGIPVHATDRCAANFYGAERLPFRYEVESWASVLADNQWTIDEMKNGTAWRMLKENG